MPSPNSYMLVRLEDSIRDYAVLVYDAARDMIVDSGLVAENGTIHAAAGTVSVGVQDMSSAGEQVIWRNANSQVTYAPPWHILDEVNIGGSRDRYYAPLQQIERFSVDTDVLENPSFSIHIPTNEVVFRLQMDFPEARDNIEFKIAINDFEMWREIKNVSAGINEIRLDIPIALYAGDFVFSITNFDKTTEPVKVKGNLQTGEVAYHVFQRDFYEKMLATEEFVADFNPGGGNPPSAGTMLKSTYDTNLNDIVDKAEAIEGILSAGNSTYYGKDASGIIGFHSLPTTPLATLSTSTGPTVEHIVESFKDIQATSYTFKLVIPSNAFPAFCSIKSIVGDTILSKEIDSFTFNRSTGDFTLPIGDITDGLIFIEYWELTSEYQ